MHTHSTRKKYALTAAVAAFTLLLASTAALQGSVAARPQTLSLAKNPPAQRVVRAMSVKDKTKLTSLCKTALATAAKKTRLTPLQQRWSSFCNTYAGPKASSASSAQAVRQTASAKPPSARSRRSATAGSTTQPAGDETVRPAAPDAAPAMTFKGACVVISPDADMPAYDAADAGAGYAKLKRGSELESYDVIGALCGAQEFATLANTFCSTYPGASYHRFIFMYDAAGLLAYGPVNDEWDPFQCPSASSAQAASSVLAETGSRGMCVVRDAYTSLPGYAAADAGTGYAKTNKGAGFASLNAVKDACASAYDELGATFCAQNPGGSYQRQVATFDLQNNWQSLTCATAGCAWVSCES